MPTFDIFTGNDYRMRITADSEIEAMKKFLKDYNLDNLSQAESFFNTKSIKAVQLAWDPLTISGNQDLGGFTYIGNVEEVAVSRQALNRDLDQLYNELRAIVEPEYDIFDEPEEETFE